MAPLSMNRQTSMPLFLSYITSCEKNYCSFLDKLSKQLADYTLIDYVQKSIHAGAEFLTPGCQ